MTVDDRLRGYGGEVLQKVHTTKRPDLGYCDGRII